MFDIHPATPADAGEVFTLQRAAFVDEAQAYGDPFVLPLTESLDRIGRVLAQEDALVLKAVDGARIVGVVRAATGGTNAVIGRLAVAPDQRRRGIARALLTRLEEGLRARYPGLTSLTLSTGAQSAGEQRLYRERGFAETSRERVADHLVMVHMRKEVVPAVRSGEVGRGGEEPLPSEGAGAPATGPGRAL